MFLTEGKMKASNVSYDEAKMNSFDRKYKAIAERKIMSRISTEPISEYDIQRTAELAERFGW